MKKPSVLGGLSVQKFLREHWHKKPLLIRQAIPSFAPILSRAALFKLAADPDVESRLVEREGAQWRLEHGPFTRLPPLRKSDWTLLVQGVNLHDDAAAALMDLFRFIPDARLDDLMISYATDGGGVGPHFDSYDVFLLQAQGRRRWRISAQEDLTLHEGLPLKILKNFEPEQEFVLEPGDMLYLPPHYAHDGTALAECMTYSIGFRAPSYQELGEGFLQFVAESLDLPGRYADPELSASRHPSAIPDIMVEKVTYALQTIAFDAEDIAIFLGEYLSEPKPGVVFAPPQRKLPDRRFAEAAQERGVRLSRQTRALYRGRHFFINGESFDVGLKDRSLLRRLADERALPPTAWTQTSPNLREALMAWYHDGWLFLG